MDNNIKQDAFVEGLELAARGYAAGSPFTNTEIYAFIAGGKWMAQQIYNAIKTMVENNDVWMH